MKIKLNISLFSIILLVGIVAALLYTNRSVRRGHTATSSALDSTSTAFDVYRLKTGATVSDQKAVILDQNDALALGLLEQERLEELNLKTVEVNVRLTERIAVLEKEGEYDDTVYIYVDSTTEDYSRYIKVPAGFMYKDKWVSLHATVDLPYPTFDTIAFWSYPEITLGWQRQGFMKKKQRKVIYTNLNPYITVTDMQNVIIKEPKKWYQTDVAKVSGGIVAFEVLRILLTNN